MCFAAFTTNHNLCNLALTLTVQTPHEQPTHAEKNEKKKETIPSPRKETKKRKCIESKKELQDIIDKNCNFHKNWICLHWWKEFSRSDNEQFTFQYLMYKSLNIFHSFLIMINHVEYAVWDHTVVVCDLFEYILYYSIVPICMYVCVYVCC